MLPNEVFALACRAYYAENDIIVDSTNGEFAHCPYPKGMGEKGYYLLWEHHQQQGILQSKDVGQCCFFIGHARKWLIECDPFPDNYFELWEIYEEFSSLHCKGNSEFLGQIGAENLKRLHSAKDELGRSLHAMRNLEKINERLHSVKDGRGKCILMAERGRKAMAKVHSVKNEEGKSVHAVKVGKMAAERLHKEKDEFGRSVQGVKSAERLNSQVWESTEDGFRSTPGNVAQHNMANGWDPNARIRIS